MQYPHYIKTTCCIACLTTFETKSTVSNIALTISVLQAYSAVTTEYGIPSDCVRKSTASLQIKISAAQLNCSNRNVIIF